MFIFKKTQFVSVQGFLSQILQKCTGIMFWWEIRIYCQFWTESNYFWQILKIFILHYFKVSSCYQIIFGIVPPLYFKRAWQKIHQVSYGPKICDSVDNTLQRLSSIKKALSSPPYLTGMRKKTQHSR